MPVPDPKSIIRRAQVMGYGWDVICPCGWESWQPLPHLALSAAEVHVKLRHGEDEQGSAVDREWSEPSSDALDRLTQWGVLAADRPVLDAFLNVTQAELTRIAVRAALRMLLANGLIEGLLPSETDEGWVQIDPPRDTGGDR